ncbi:MAG: hypothetical protein HYX61_03465 [Gammaproteobacteria bacterium]|jgi:hypothetical protein|nr:hypothetical protein [Gammaproteobacteria bacterium]
MLKIVNTIQTQQISAGYLGDITSEMPDLPSNAGREIYTIIKKTMCDYVPQVLDLQVI